MTEKESAIFLNLIPGVGSIKIKRLLEHFGSFSKAAGAAKSELIKIEGISAKIAQDIVGKNVELDKEGKIRVKIYSLAPKEELVVDSDIDTPEKAAKAAEQRLVAVQASKVSVEDIRGDEW